MLYRDKEERERFQERDREVIREASDASLALIIEGRRFQVIEAFDQYKHKTVMHDNAVLELKARQDQQANKIEGEECPDTE